jgi:molecular chaperone GrpE (heat shock protein)
MWPRGKREYQKKEHQKEINELKRLRKENEVLKKDVHRLEKKVQHLQKELETEHKKRVEERDNTTLFSASGCVSVTVDVDDGINTDYVYEDGEKTIYDCIQEAKALGLEMRVVNDKLGSMDGKQFVKWFEEYKGA